MLSRNTLAPESVIVFIAVRSTKQTIVAYYREDFMHIAIYGIFNMVFDILIIF